LFAVFTIQSSRAIALNDLSAPLFTGIPIFLINLILFIIGVITRKKDGESIFKFSKFTTFIVSFICVIVSSLLIVLAVPKFVNDNINNNGEEYVLNYLNQKYGDANYKIENIGKGYSYGGFVSADLESYDFTVRCDYFEDTFEVSLYDNFSVSKKDASGIRSDNFGEVYYPATCNFKDRFDFSDYVEEKTGIRWFNCYDIRHVIPNDYGKVPTLDELCVLAVDFYAETTVDMVNNAPVSDASYFSVTNVSGGVAITEYFGPAGIVVIPETINGKTVVEIKDEAFAFNTLIKGIKLADTIKVVGEDAFNNCDNLQVFVAGSGLKKLKTDALDQTDKLRYIELNDGLEVIEYSAITSNSDFDSIYVPSSVKSIESSGIILLGDEAIICEPGSAAEKYAKKQGYNYEYR
jgi:hypothetical protein